MRKHALMTTVLTFYLIPRHIQVAAMMKREKAHIKHRFDPWHLAKSVRQDLIAASKKRDCSDLTPWIGSVVNHLWWCAATSDGNQLLCQEKWKSIIYHVAGIHQWPDFQLFSECRHDELTNEQRRNKVWLPIGSPAHNALKEVALKPKLLKDVCLLADFVQTGSLEVFHGSMAKKYVSKSQHYSYRSMVSRTQQCGERGGNNCLRRTALQVCLPKASEAVGRKANIRR